MIAPRPQHGRTARRPSRGPAATGFFLALLAAFALATASAMNHGMSLRAMGSIVAFALALPIALLAVRHRPSWVGVVTAVPVLLFSIPSLVEIGRAHV